MVTNTISKNKDAHKKNGETIEGFLFYQLFGYKAFRKFSCTDRFINIIEAIHTDMQANVAMSGCLW